MSTYRLDHPDAPEWEVWPGAAARKTTTIAVESSQGVINVGAVSVLFEADEGALVPTEALLHALVEIAPDAVEAALLQRKLRHAGDKRGAS